MVAYLDWATDGADWPNRDASRFVDAAGLRWHVQVMGQGPVVLLLHGTGASTHSWRDVMPKLASAFTVVAPDLPGHGFTTRSTKASLSLPGMAAAVSGLLRELKLSPERAAGHSAGAAVLVRMAVERLFTPDLIVSFNGAFFPVSGVAGQFFSPLAKAVAGATVMQKLFARMADRSAVERLLKDTGSRLDETGLKLYQRLFANEGHIAGTLGMMAAWDLHWVPQDLKNLTVPLYLVRASKDRTIAPANAERAAQLAPKAMIIDMEGLGHLAHEEDPATAAAIIADPQAFVRR
ncbi:alpha/beta fold hydrolase BchO [Aestuariivirga sp.]|uniref:alpha/beta fold hydrolase BchO n=1 Tax=Aestuariivirga sp. TaxID=2650926 RepID=UPI0035938594